MRQRRVVVTGLGVVAPNGIGKDAWKNLIAGKSAADYITTFHPSPFPSQIVAEILVHLRPNMDWLRGLSA